MAMIPSGHIAIPLEMAILTEEIIAISSDIAIKLFNCIANKCIFAIEYLN